MIRMFVACRVRRIHVMVAFPCEGVPPVTVVLFAVHVSRDGGTDEVQTRNGGEDILTRPYLTTPSPPRRFV